MSRDLQLVIFDCDGVLVDSETISSRVLAQMLSEQGLPTTLAQSRRTYQGMLLADIATQAERELGRALPEDWLARYETERDSHTLSPGERREYETQLHTGSVTLDAVKDEERAGAVPYTAQAIEAGRALLAIPGASDSTAIISGVVPDGVSSVAIAPETGATATAQVTNNLFVVELPASELKALTVKWYAAGGSLTKTVWIEHVPSVLPPTSGPTLIEVSPPPAVVHAGGRQLAEFEQGRLAVAQSGCLACHRIGQNGNHGPGPNLTHIGSKLSRRGIEHAIVDPTAPMPSFKNLPRARFKAVVVFLHELR